MENTAMMIGLAELVDMIERKARDLDVNAEATPASVVRAVNQGQAIVLRELVRELQEISLIETSMQLPTNQSSRLSAAPSSRTASTAARRRSWSSDTFGVSRNTTAG